MKRLEESELTVGEMIRWLEVLSNGYAKPDLSDRSTNGSGTVKETKNYMPFIMAINQKLCGLYDIECPEVSEFLTFKREPKNGR